ncbi:MAG: hypothetical protein LW823_04560 [Rickettsiales bacterium]|nr:hypothetical protein [Rickettsiales bacterium]
MIPLLEAFMGRLLVDSGMTAKQNIRTNQNQQYRTYPSSDTMAVWLL